MDFSFVFDFDLYLPGRPSLTSGHDAVRILLTDLGDQQRAHAGAGAAAQRMGHLEALKMVGLS